MVEKADYYIGRSPWGQLAVAASEKGVIMVRLQTRKNIFLRELKEKGFKPLKTRSGPAFEAFNQIVEYLKGVRKYFTVDLDLRGTDFQRRVWREVMKIPYGKLRTYGEVAGAAGYSKAYRAAGNAIGANPVPIIVPCHRVVRSDCTLGGYGGREDLKEKLLKLEGSYHLIKKMKRV
jgi:O-6-methylguanine DNA methyltransferase